MENTPAEQFMAALRSGDGKNDRPKGSEYVTLECGHSATVIQ